MRTDRIIMGAFALLSLGTPFAAQAQSKYYMRERIVGLPVSTTPPATPPQSYTYVPTYSTTYSSCAAGSQSAPITKCTRSDGATADVSLCSPQTTSRTCTSTYSTCAALDLGQPNSGTGVIVGSDLTSPEAAQSACNAYLATNRITTAGVCYFVQNRPSNSFNNKALWYAGAVVLVQGTAGQIYASSCSR